MARVVALIDYGSGNLRSAEKALRRAADGLRGAPEILTTADPDLIAGAERVVLPGVGAFAACIAGLAAAAGVIEAVDEAVRQRGAPFLGICVGMQLMATRGLEFGETPGLGWIAGDVERFEPRDRSIKVPHVGWNAVECAPGSALLGAPPSSFDAYFTHSYVFRPRDLADVAAWSDHGGRFAAAVVRENLVGVQFHPEKSQAAGLRLLANFLEWRP
jgi:glutamine amidotransferase